MTSKRESTTRKQILSLTFFFKAALSFMRLKIVHCELAEIEFLSFILPHVKVLILTSLKAPELDLLKTEPKV